MLDGRRVRRHVDHIRGRSSEMIPPTALQSEDFPVTSPTPSDDGGIPAPPVPAEHPAAPPPATPNIRRSVRNVPPPNYLQYGPNFEPM